MMVAGWKLFKRRCTLDIRQETQLSLTNRATHLEVSQGHTIWYHGSIC